MPSHAAVKHLASFAAGMLVLFGAQRWLEWRRSLADATTREEEEEEEEESEEETDEEGEEGEQESERDRRLRIHSYPIRDDYEGDETYKMLLICNMELFKLSSKTGELKPVKMSAGKAAAQCSHATLGAYRRGVRLSPQAVRDWLRIGQMKITLKCPTLDELLKLEEDCALAGLNTCLIRDAGHTEIEPGSRTVLAVGPAPASAINPLTGHLKPY